jgi:hypothetical protein
MSLSRPRALLLGTLVLAVSAGCRLHTDNEVRRERQLALIEFYGDPVVLAIPDTVAVGSPFEVTVRTYGGGCIDPGDTEVSLTGQAATVRPYDVFVTDLPPNYVCNDDLRLYTHRATLRFDQRGPATVTVRGRVRPGDSAIAVQRSVHVR